MFLGEINEPWLINNAESFCGVTFFLVILHSVMNELSVNPTYLSKAERFCAMGEQCEYAVREKLRTWGASDEESDAVVERLKALDFLNERRFVEIYCRSKVRQQRWGRRKIQYQLRMKRIPDVLIREGMSAVADEDYFAALQSVAESKWRTCNPADSRSKYKLTAFLQSHGFELDEIKSVIEKLF